MDTTLSFKCVNGSLYFDYVPTYDHHNTFITIKKSNIIYTSCMIEYAQQLYKKHGYMGSVDITDEDKKIVAGVNNLMWYYNTYNSCNICTDIYCHDSCSFDYRLMKIGFSNDNDDRNSMYRMFELSCLDHDYTAWEYYCEFIIYMKLFDDVAKIMGFKKGYKDKTCIHERDVRFNMFSCAQKLNNLTILENHVCMLFDINSWFSFYYDCRKRTYKIMLDPKFYYVDKGCSPPNIDIPIIQL